MNKEELGKECRRLWAFATIEEGQEVLDIYLNYLFLVIENSQGSKNKTTEERDARLINQMIFTKIAYLKKILDGISFTSSSGSKLNKIIDPTIVASFIRNLYETIGMFNLIYINTKSEDEKKIVYNLWVHAGLKFRQRFGPSVTDGENLKKLEYEQKTLLKLKEEIENTDLYKNLDEKNQTKIQNKLTEKDYKINIANDIVEFLSWQDLISIMGIRNKIMGQTYTYFSLYSHPSNVAVFQFGDMFKKNDPQFSNLTLHNLTYAFSLISVFIADYIKLFPKNLEIFNSLDLKSQIVINFFNTFARDMTYSINDSYKNLD